MARTDIPVKTSGRVSASAAITFTNADAANNHSFDNSSEKVLLHIRNDGAGPFIVSIKRPATIDGATLADLQVTVTNATEAIVGPFPKSIYNQTGDVVYVDAPATPTGLKFATIKLGSL